MSRRLNENRKLAAAAAANDKYEHECECRVVVVHNGVHSVGRQANVLQGLHIPADLGLAGLVNTAHHLALHTSRRRSQDSLEQNRKLQRGRCP